MNYKILHITGYDDELIAKLNNIGFESFEENGNELMAYIKESDFQHVDPEELDTIIYGLDIKWSDLENKNWNEVWEANFQPVAVNDFCRVRADFHPPMAGFRYDIIINPKMAFGTGHHQTTWMMIAQMKDIDFSSKKVLDYGCGTGILAIMASKLGASYIDAVDIEEESYLNTLENAKNNHTTNINSICGTLDDISDIDYDIILANINRNVLLDTGLALTRKLKEGGTLLLSGLLTKDEEIILNKYVHDMKYTLLNKMQKDDWICLRLVKDQEMH